jgi:hypothetical protein
LPNGVIALWLGTIATIPAQWKICDGTFSTPNLLDRFVKALNTTGELGTTGGAATHTHAAPATHSHTVADHTHAAGTLATSATTDAAAKANTNNSASADYTHTHTVPSFTTAAGTSSSDAAGAATANTDNAPPYTTVAFIQYQPAGAFFPLFPF